MVLVVDDRSPAPAGAADRGRRRRARLRLRPAAGRRGPLGGDQRRPHRRGRARHGRLPRRRRGSVLRVARLARAPARPHGHRRRARRGRRRRRASTPTALIRQAGYFFSLFRRDLERAASATSRETCSTSHAPLLLPGRLGAAADPPRAGSSASASTTSSSRPARGARLLPARERGRAASASSSRPSAPARSSPPTASPTSDGRRRARLRVKHAGVNFQPLESRRSSDASASEDHLPRLRARRASRTTAASCPRSRSAPTTRLGVDRRAAELVVAGGLGDRAADARRDLVDYEVVVAPAAARRRLAAADPRAAGARASIVLYEIDDYVQSARKIKSHELADDVRRGVRPRASSSAMRVADGVICSTEYLARRYRVVQPAHVGVPQRHRPRALRAGRARARRRDDRLGRRRRAQGVARALGAGAALRAARAARGALRVRRPPAPPASYVEEFGPSGRSRSSRRQLEVYPASMSAVRRRDRAVGGEQPVPRQERPALARGERARHPAGRAPRRLSGDRGRRHRRPRAHPRGGRGGAAAADRRPRAARAHRPPAREYVAEHRRVQVAAERWRDVLHRGRAGRRLRSSYRSLWGCRIPRLAKDGDSRSHTGHPRPLHSRSLEVHTGCWRATHTYPTEGRIARAAS